MKLTNVVTQLLNEQEKHIDEVPIWNTVKDISVFIHPSDPRYTVACHRVIYTKISVVELKYYIHFDHPFTGKCYGRDFYLNKQASITEDEYLGQRLNELIQTDVLVGRVNDVEWVTSSVCCISQTFTNEDVSLATCENMNTYAKALLQTIK